MFRELDWATPIFLERAVSITPNTWVCKEPRGVQMNSTDAEVRFIGAKPKKFF
jgi:hypothetical protein